MKQNIWKLFNLSVMQRLRHAIFITLVLLAAIIPLGLVKNSKICGKTINCVICFSLYGTDEKYTIGALRNIFLWKKIYPGWQFRVYHNSSVPRSILKKLSINGAKLHEVKKLPPATAMFWRFLVIEDSAVDYYIIRDCDSRLNDREKTAVNEWMGSPYKFHAMRDHPNHQFQIMGGMWGGSGKFLRFNISRHLQKISSFRYGDDQNFLASHIFPLIRHTLLTHDSFHCKKHNNSISFPSKRNGFQHVGQRYNSSDHPTTFNIWKSPTECRRNPQWEYG
jgi:hypothetical protein